MNIEKEIFKKSVIVFDKLIPYGFRKEKENYIIRKKIMDDTLEIIVKITLSGDIQGKVMDLSFGEEYTNYRLENQMGEFASQVREEYSNFLLSIRDRCTITSDFTFDQTNRLSNWIVEKYHDQPDFPWEKSPSDGIFRNPKNGKWYGLIMNIDRSKIDDEKGEVEILNVKLEGEKIQKILGRKGFYKAYHMNKEKWITIVLDGTLKDEEIQKYLEESHQFTEEVDEWIVPANPKYYDVIHCFDDKEIINWKQSSNIQIGDIVYLYVAAPYSAILFQCEVLETNIPYQYEHQNLSISKVMRLKLRKRYAKEKFTFEVLNQYGIKAIRGPRRLPKKLSDKMHLLEE